MSIPTAPSGHDSATLIQYRCDVAASKFLNWIKAALLSVDWEILKVKKAHVGLIALECRIGSWVKFSDDIENALTPYPGPDGFKFQFVLTGDSPPEGVIPVFVDQDQDTASKLETLGATVKGRLGYDYHMQVIPGITEPNITFITTANSKRVDIYPTGATFQLNGNLQQVGTAFSYGGGFRIKSLSAGSRFVILDMVTGGIGDEIDIMIADDDEVEDWESPTLTYAFKWNAYHPNQGTWLIYYCRYQFIFMRIVEIGLVNTPQSTAGYYFLASSTSPMNGAGLMLISGGRGLVQAAGGDRFNLESIGTDGWYIETTANFRRRATSELHSPRLVIPGYGYGITPSDFVHNNIENRDIHDEDGNASINEAIIACPDNTGKDYRYSAQGVLWNAFVAGTYMKPDRSLNIFPGASGICLFASEGTKGKTRGALSILG